MTTEDFTEAARSASEAKYLAMNPDASQISYPRRVLREGKRAAFRIGAEWARTHLAAQEPTEEMVDAAVAGREERGWFTSAGPEDNRDEMRAIISDALAARRRDMEEQQ